MRALRILAGLALLLFVSGCLVETEATLGDPDPKTVDPRLLGTWVYAEKDEASVISIAADPDRPGVYRAVFAGIKAARGKPVEYATYEAWRTVVNGQSYLTVRRTGGTSIDQPGLTIMAYDIGADGTLIVRLMSPRLAIAAIKAGRLEGTYKEGRYSSEAKITSSRADLVAFIAAAKRDELFDVKTAVFRKAADAAK